LKSTNNTSVIKKNNLKSGNSPRKNFKIEEKIISHFKEKKKRDREELLSKIRKKEYFVPGNNISKCKTPSSQISMKNFKVPQESAFPVQSNVFDPGLNFSEINFETENKLTDQLTPGDSKVFLFVIISY
jgi:hypothetical protein